MITSGTRIDPPDSRYVIRAADACVRAYAAYTHSAGNSEGLLDGDTFAVRGTTAAFGKIILGDWGMNSLALPWRSGEYPELGWCHKGFLRGGGIWAPGGAIGLWRAAKRELIHGAPKLICGHSKGGDEACILAALMVLAGKPPRALITFGAPKFTVTDAIFRRLRRVPQEHFTHGLDVVPSLPCAPWWLDFPRDHLEGGREHRVSDKITDHFMSAYRCAVYGRYGLVANGTCPVV